MASHLLSLALLAASLSPGCAGPARVGPGAGLLVRFEYEQAAMGTRFRIVLHAPDEGTAAEGARAAFARIAELDAMLSDYDPESELSRLCRTSDVHAPTAPVPVSVELFELLSRAQALAAETGGAFDATVGPLVRVWRRARRRAALPEAAELTEARSRVGYAHITLDPEERSVQLLVRGMRLDLGGIAKGYAVDAALSVLARRGLVHALVDGGGDVAVGAPPPGRPGWRVELARHRTGEPAEVLSLAHVAIATSGDLERFLEVDGVRYSHLVDPRSGRALTVRRLVTVVAPDGARADALASALSILGPEGSQALLREDAQARIATALDAPDATAPAAPIGRLQVWRTSGFPEALSSP